MNISIYLTLSLFVSTQAMAANKEMVMHQTASNQRNCSQKVSDAFLREMQRHELKTVSVKGEDGNGNLRNMGASVRSFEVIYQDRNTGAKYSAQMKVAFEPNKSGFKCHPVSFDVYSETTTAFHWPQNVAVADSN